MGGSCSAGSSSAAASGTCGSSVAASGRPSGAGGSPGCASRPAASGLHSSSYPRSSSKLPCRCQGWVGGWVDEWVGTRGRLDAWADVAWQPRRPGQQAASSEAQRSSQPSPAPTSKKVSGRSPVLVIWHVSPLVKLVGSQLRAGGQAWGCASGSGCQRGRRQHCTARLPKHPHPHHQPIHPHP